MKDLVILEDDREEIELSDEDKSDNESDKEVDILDRIWAEIPESRPDDNEEEEEEIDLVEYDGEEEPEEFEFGTEPVQEKPSPTKSPKVYEDSATIPPVLAVLDRSDVEGASATQQARIDRLSALLKEHGIDINDYDPRTINWGEWSTDDIREHNNLINYIKFDVSEWSKSVNLKEVDPYAMAQVRIDLWPDVAIGDTTVRQAIKDLLHNGDPNAWSEAERGTQKYESLQKLYAISREYYRRNHDKATQLDNIDFLNEYSEYNSETPTGVESSLLVGLFKIKGTDKYIPVSFTEIEKARQNARQNGAEEITITRAGADGKSRQIPVEPVLTDPAEIKGRLSFAPRSGRRMLHNDNWSKPQKVGALNNAIVNLFSSPSFHPAVMKKNPHLVDWETIAKLQKPLSYYNRMAAGVRGNYLLGWEDDALLKLYRMFASVLPSVSRYDDEIRSLQSELEHTKDEQRAKDIQKKIDELQDLIDNPPSPNREEWERNYVAGKSYPARVASPADQLENMSKNLGDVHLYRYVGPHPDLHREIIRSPRKIEGLQNYKYIGPMQDIIELGVVGELKKVEKMVDKAREELQRSTKDKKEEFDKSKVMEGTITSPVTIMVNGGPFKLHFGDRLIIDNVKKANFHQK